MSLKDIFLLLESKISPVDFLVKYQEEFVEYEKKSKKRGSSISIIIEDTFSFCFTKKHIIKIFDFFIQKKLSELEINYLVDGILLSEKIDFENEEIVEILESLTDQEINGSITKKQIEKYRTLVTG